LFDKTAKVSGELMVDIIRKHEKAYPNKITGRPQEERSNKSRYYSRRKWESPDFMKIDFSQNAQSVYFKILANTQEAYIYNGAFAVYHEQKIICRKAEYIFDPCPHAESGTIVAVTEQGLQIACGDGKSVLISQIQKG